MRKQAKAKGKQEMKVQRIMDIGAVMLIGRYVRLNRQRKVRKVADIRLPMFVEAIPTMPVWILFEGGSEAQRQLGDYVEVFSRKPRAGSHARLKG